MIHPLGNLQKGCLMAIAIQQISPVAHLPLVLGVVRKLNVAALIDTFCPPHPAHVLSCGHGVEALLLAILDGHHALYKVGGTSGGARDAPLAPGGPWTRVAERLPPRPDSRGAVWRKSQPRVWGHRPQRPGRLCHRDPLAPSGYNHAHLVWGL